MGITKTDNKPKESHLETLNSNNINDFSNLLGDEIKS